MQTADEEERIRYARGILKLEMTQASTLPELSGMADLSSSKLKKGFLTQAQDRKNKSRKWLGIMLEKNRFLSMMPTTGGKIQNLCPVFHALDKKKVEFSMNLCFIVYRLRGSHGFCRFLDNLA
jgi:hypothetical protein